jgi:hypothetical protein
MKKKILRTFKLAEISCVDFPAQEGARMTIMKSTETARVDAVAQLHERKLRELMEMKGLTRQEAEATLGPGPDASVAKATPTAADTANASIEVLADYRGVNKHAAIAKFLDTDMGRSLYESYADAKNEPAGGLIAKRKISSAFDALVDVFVKQHGVNRWKAANEVLKTKLGAAIYRAMSEAA